MGVGPVPPIPAFPVQDQGWADKAGSHSLWALTSNTGLTRPADTNSHGRLGSSFKSDQGSDPTLAEALDQVPLPHLSFSISKLKTIISALEANLWGVRG